MLTFTIDARDPERQLGRKIDLMSDGLMLHKIAGTVLETEMLDRFDAGTAPDGSKWQDHAPVTKLLRGNRQGALLRQRGDLRGSLGMCAYADHADIGAFLNHPKVWVHQNGAIIRPVRAKKLYLGRAPGGGGIFINKATIPARPYVGLGAGDGDLVMEALIDYLRG